MLSKDFNTRAQWLKWRHEGIGGSDVAKLFNASKYGTIDDLLKDKLGPQPKEIELYGPIQVQAQVTEHEARQALSKHLGYPIEPINIEDKEHPQLRVSLDGYNAQHQVLLEHKMMGKARREAAEAWLKDNEHFLAHIDKSPIAETAYQIAYQCLLTRPKKVFLIITDFKTGDMKVYLNEPDRIYTQVGLMVKKKALEFWELRCRQRDSLMK